MIYGMFSNRKFLLALLILAVGLLATLLIPTAVSAEEESPEVLPIADVSESLWFHAHVKHLAGRGIFEGSECKRGFCPYRPLLRWEMAVWLVRFLGEKDLSDYDSRFQDVPDNDWRTPYIERLADLGITVGCRSEPLRFCPDRLVNRAQMASFLARALDLPPAPDAGFEDVDPEGVHADNINRLYAASPGITTGCRSEPLRFCPGSPVKRAQMAVFLYRSQFWHDLENGSGGQIAGGISPETFRTEENEVSRFVRYEIVELYAADNPWLMDVWDYTNRLSFKYSARDEHATGYVYWEPSYEIPGGTETRLTKNVVAELSVNPWILSHSDRRIFLHEMAHIYTLANGVSANPAPLASAHLYFDSIDDGPGGACPGHELYADTVASLAPLRYPYFYYWGICSHLPDEPTMEAREVVKTAFAGEMPQWFYDSFEKDGGSLDYQAIWLAVKDLEPRYRMAVVYQLKDAFGGYCSERRAIGSAFGKFKTNQVWRDGGC